MKKPTKKLEVKTHTVRALTPAALTETAGAMTAVTIHSCQTSYVISCQTGG